MNIFDSKGMHCVHLEVGKQGFETSWFQELQYLKP